MPSSYRDVFDASDAAAHFAVVEGRAPGETRAEVWKTMPDGVVAVCVVADDRPGLLSQLNAALVAHEVDVLAAQALLRVRDDARVDAIHLLYVRRTEDAAGRGPVRAVDLVDIPAMIDGLARGRASFGGTFGSTRAEPSAPLQVSFDRDEARDVTVLTIEAHERPGLLLTITRTLFRASIQIVGLRSSSEAGRAVHRLELAEIDGTQLRGSRVKALRSLILAALDEGELAGRDRDGSSRERAERADVAGRGWVGEPAGRPREDEVSVRRREVATRPPRSRRNPDR